VHRPHARAGPVALGQRTRSSTGPVRRHGGQRGRLVRSIAPPGRTSHPSRAVRASQARTPRISRTRHPSAQLQPCEPSRQGSWGCRGHPWAESGTDPVHALATMTRRWAIPRPRLYPSPSRPLPGILLRSGWARWCRPSRCLTMAASSLVTMFGCEKAPPVDSGGAFVWMVTWWSSVVTRVHSLFSVIADCAAARSTIALSAA
jgi:hypothetical protein